MSFFHDRPLELAQQLIVTKAWGGISFTTARLLVPTMCLVSKFFSKEVAKYPSSVPFVPKTQIISTVVQYDSLLETAGNPSACSWQLVHIHVVRYIAMFLSCDAASHSRRVFEL